MELKNKFMQGKKDLVQNRCKIITSNIERQITKYDENKNDHFKRYYNLRDKLSRAISVLTAQGVDVTTLTSDLAQLEDLLAKFSTDYAAFIDSLKNTQNFGCGTSDGEFSAALETSRTKLATLRQDALEIRNFYKDTIKTHILEIRRELSKLKEDKSNGTE